MLTTCTFKYASTSLHHWTFIFNTTFWIHCHTFEGWHLVSMKKEGEQLTIANLVKKKKDQNNSRGQWLWTIHEISIVRTFHTWNLDCQNLSYMKSWLWEHFRDHIIVTEINGKHNVTILSTTKCILHELNVQSRPPDYSESEGIRIIETAAQLIKNHIKGIKTSSEYYPSRNDLEQNTILEYVQNM